MTTTRSRATLWVLIVLTIAGLGVDAYVHFDLASQYDAIASTVLSQGDLFRAEAIAAIVLGAAFLLRPRRYTAVLAALIGAGGAAAVLVYRYSDVPAFGPIPRMYEPVWYTEKTISLIAELVAAVAALAAVGVLTAQGRRPAAAAAPRPLPSH